MAARGRAPGLAIRWIVLFAGPAVTQGETDGWAELAGGGNGPPSRSESDMEAEVLARGPSGFDPMPAIRALQFPSLWLYGRLDYVLPTRLSMRRLESVGRVEIATDVFPQASHALVETQTGLNSEMLASDRFAPGLFPRVRDWVRGR